MRKVAIISESCYAHIDFDLIPFLRNSFVVGWFPFFASVTSENTIMEFINRTKSMHLSDFSYLHLSHRMRSLSTRKEFKGFLVSIQSFSPDVIYVNADGFPWLPILLKQTFKNIPIIGAIHDVKAHSGTSMIAKVYKPLLPKFYKYLNTYSDYSFYQLLDRQLKNKQISCCHHPFSDFGIIEKKKHDKFTVLFFGNLIAYKGLPLLLKAGELAYKQNEKICIKIVGRGKDEYLLEPYKNHPGFIIINRRVEDSEIPEIFSDVDCLALPYNDATQSGPMMIALNYKIPVLATDIPAFAWYREHFSEVHLLKNDSKVWAEQFIRYASMFPLSFNRLKKYAQEIEFERKKILQEWETLFLGLEK